MKIKNKLWIILILPVLLAWMIAIHPQAASAFDPAFQVKFGSDDSEGVAASCIDAEKRFYEVVNPSIAYAYTISGNLPEGYNSVTLSGMNCPNHTYKGNKVTLSEETFEITLDYNYRYYTTGVYEIIFEDGEGNGMSYYLILDGEPYLYTGYGDKNSEDSSTYYYYAHQIDLVDSSDASHSIIYNVFNEEEDYERYPERNLYQKLSLSSEDYDHIALQIGREEPLDVPETYDGNITNPWLYTGEKYYRVNGGEWIRFSESTSGEEYISPNLELEDGKNLVEIYQRYCIVGLTKAGKFSLAQNPESYGLSHVLLIDYDGSSKSSADADTDLREIHAYSWVQEKGDAYRRCETEMDEATDAYSITVPAGLSYTPLIIEVGLENPGASWELVDADGKNIEISSMGRYRTIDSSDLTSFYIRVTSADGTVTALKKVDVSVSVLSTEAWLTGLSFGSRVASLIDGETVDKDTAIYTVTTESETITVLPTVSEKATVTVDGQEVGESGVTVAPETQKLSTIRVTAEDGFTENVYHILYQYKGEYPYFGISESTKELAESLLSGYKEHVLSEGETKDLSSSYWSVFSAVATGISLDNAYVYDVSQSSLSYPSEYAGVILELCMIGENPYDFNGRNYVEELAAQGPSFGAWAANVWAYIAFKVAGYDYEYMDSLAATVKSQANRRTSGASWSLDISGWAIAAVADMFTLEERADWAQWIYEKCQEKSGECAGIFQDVYYQVPNSNTHGCILTGLNAIGVDPEMFAVSEEKTPLKTLRDVLMLEDGRFMYSPSVNSISYNKDVIVGLGDLVSGSNVWNRSAVTQEKLDELLEKTKSLLGTGSASQNSALAAAYAAAQTVEDVTKEGEKYYALLTAAAEIDGSLTPDVKMYAPEDAETIEKLIEEISALGEVTLEKASVIEELETRYESLSSDVARSYVTNRAVLLDAVEKLETMKKESGQADTTEETLTASSTQTTIKEEITAADSPQTISVRRVKGLKVKRLSSGKIKISWKKVKKSSGYEVWIENAKGKYRRVRIINKAKKTVCFIKKNRKNIAVKVRAYILVNNKKIFGKFSLAKKIN